MAATFRELMQAPEEVARQAEESAQQLERFIQLTERGLSQACQKLTCCRNKLVVDIADLESLKWEREQWKELRQDTAGFDASISRSQDELREARDDVAAAEHSVKLFEQALAKARELQQWHLDLVEVLRRSHQLLAADWGVLPWRWTVEVNDHA